MIQKFKRHAILLSMDITSNFSAITGFADNILRAAAQSQGHVDDSKIINGRASFSDTELDKVHTAVDTISDRLEESDLEEKQYLASLKTIAGEFSKLLKGLHERFSKLNIGDAFINQIHNDLRQVKSQS